MSAIVCANEWLEEEVDNLARDGLRTLVIAKKDLTMRHMGCLDKEIQNIFIINDQQRFFISRYN